MNNSKIWILIAGIIAMVSGFLIYSTVKTKEADRSSFMAKIQDLQTKTTEMTKLQSDLEELRKEKAALEAKAQSDIATLEAQVAESKKSESVLRAKIESVNKEKESLAKYMENNNVIVSKLQKKNEALENERKRLLDEAVRKSDSVPRFIDPMNEQPLEVRASDASPGSKIAQEQVVDLGRIVIRQATNQPATVEHVNTLYGFIVLSAGTRDGLQKDSIVNVTRNNRLIAKAVVKKAREEAASAVTLPEWTREEIRVGDLISINSPGSVTQS